MSEIEQDIKKVVITFFAPPLNDKDSKNDELRKKVKNSGRFDHGGYMFRTREVYDTYRYGGIYHEVARKRLKAYDPDCPLDDLSFITLAYKALEPEPVKELLDNWKTWTGARAILEDFGDKVPVQEVIFFARHYPADFDVFAYIVLLSFKNEPEAARWVLYYVQRLRVERWFGYSTVYAAAPSYRRHVGTPGTPADK
ncbi:hypothetical protein FJT64_021157 [Amphibalanus amphitrite]|uniref:DUF7153 domain-containing protein n=1 Tax=Amphibalanus amphitrite TaxID=1232801 RepID=A0A6A4WZ72_AMPAM|nr:hypothetical protein FJT64_021157 [Amphibalanus amphitrite]